MIFSDFFRCIRTHKPLYSFATTWWQPNLRPKFLGNVSTHFRYHTSVAKISNLLQGKKNFWYSYDVLCFADFTLPPQHNTVFFY
jgi:hypothetical protein